MKTAKSINTMLGGITPDFQKQGLDMFLFITTVNAAKQAGMTSIDTHVVMEDNKDMMAETKRYGSFEIKRFRVYQKQL
jgi:predicted TIM-barrel fold metal-dependent hydrolase